MNMNSTNMKGVPVACVFLLSVYFHVAAQDKSPLLYPIDCTFVGEARRTCDSASFAKAVQEAKTMALVGYEMIVTWAELTQRLDPDISDEAYDRLRTNYFNMIVLPRLKGSDNFKVNFEDFMKRTTRPPRGRPFPTGVLKREAWGPAEEKNISLQKRAIRLAALWNQSRIVSDPEVADLVLEVRRYESFDFPDRNGQPVCFILVWARGANPKADNIVWLERFQAKWKTSDDLAGAFRALRKDFGLASKEGATRAKSKPKS